MSDVTLTPRQRQTLAGRQALAAKFETPEQKSEHYRHMAERSNAGRVVLSGDEASAIADAYSLLGKIVGRTRGAEGGAQLLAAPVQSEPRPEHKEGAAGSSPAALERLLAGAWSDSDDRPAA